MSGAQGLPYVQKAPSLFLQYLVPAGCCLLGHEFRAYYWYALHAVFNPTYPWSSLTTSTSVLEGSSFALPPSPPLVPPPHEPMEDSDAELERQLQDALEELRKAKETMRMAEEAERKAQEAEKKAQEQRERPGARLNGRRSIFSSIVRPWKSCVAKGAVC